MADNAEGIIIGVDWTDCKKPLMRFSPMVGAAVSTLIPLIDGLRFRVKEPGIRRCCGWFDVASAEPRHVNCASWEKVTSGKQCSRCRNREGFVLVHQSYRGANLPENIRAYLAQPHWLYLNIFADGTVKVGTVAEARFGSRLAEQGAIASYYVARASNGVDVRKAEAAVSKRLGLVQAVSTKRKLKALCAKVEVATLSETLYTAVRDIRPLLGELASSEDWIEPADPPKVWRMPSFARALVEATPLLRYPADLARGDHSLYIEGMTGSIAMFSVYEGSDRFVDSLAALQGVFVEFGEFDSEIGSVQLPMF